MADNVTIPTTGQGTATPVIATDDVGGVHFQKIKPDLGADGATQGVSTGAGAVDAGTQRIVLGSSDLTAAAPTAATVGVASAAAVAANASRRGLVLVNTSSAFISLGLDGAAAVLYSGITLNPSGGTWVMDSDTFTLGAVAAIASAAGANMAVQEFS